MYDCTHASLQNLVMSVINVLAGNHKIHLLPFKESFHEATDMKLFVIYLQYEQASGMEQPKMEESNKMR